MRVILETDPGRYQGLLRAAGFDAGSYRARYQDLAKLSDDVALWHFAHHGKKEGRFPAFFGSLTDVRQRIGALPIAIEIRQALDQDVVTAQLADIDPDERHVGHIADILGKIDGYTKMLVIGDSHALFLIEPGPMLAAGVVPIPYI